MAINVLDQSTAEKIAAGEVIENPASVVKELVENSIDAGATSIEIIIREGGKSFISVTDNGHGLPAFELPLAFQRFATSKLNRFSDLEELNSLGFRGEALPSIAAVSRVRMVSRQPDEVSGSEIELAGGEVIGQSEVGAPPGTRVEVKDLFYNTPGRLKFLRSAAYETSRISSLISDIALSNPQIAFKLQSSARNIFRSPGDGILLHTIGSLYGLETADAMLLLEGRDRENGAIIHGYTSAPYYTRSSRKWMTIIINGRLVKNNTLISALERAYGDLLPSRRHPLAALFLQLNPASIDVNVHPAKTEIRFAKPDDVSRLVFRTVKIALQNSKNVPNWPEADRGKAEPDHFPQGNLSLPYAGKLKESAFSFDQYLSSKGAEDLFHHKKWPEESPESEEAIPYGSCHLIGQYLKSYLVVQRGEDLLLIDQHAAHERIIYETLLADKGEGREAGSQLTMPLTIQVPAKWRSRLQEILPLLNELGFNLEPLGEDSYVIRAVPFMFRGNPGEKELYDFLERLIEADDASPENARKLIYKTIACHRSVKAKQSLSRPEMMQLLEEWEKTANAGYCPHGRPVVISFKRAKLEKGFQRGGDAH